MSSDVDETDEIRQRFGQETRGAEEPSRHKAVRRALAREGMYAHRRTFRRINEISLKR
jgi:hypothetical protein